MDYKDTPPKTPDPAISSGPALRETCGQEICNRLSDNSKLAQWDKANRLRTAQKLVQFYRGTRLLDYGCGDGTFMLMNKDHFTSSIGVDPDPKRIVNNQNLFSTKAPSLTFMQLKDIADAKHTGMYEIITCMEVFEHCQESECMTILADLDRLLSSNGTVIISVPIETGPALAIKQFLRHAHWIFRRIRGSRKLAAESLTPINSNQHSERYTFVELIKMILAGENWVLTRPVDENGRHGHKGFNWLWLRKKIKRHFFIRETVFSPLPILGSLLNSHVFFVCNHRELSGTPRPRRSIH